MHNSCHHYKSDVQQFDFLTIFPTKNHSSLLHPYIYNSIIIMIAILFILVIIYALFKLENFMIFHPTKITFQESDEIINNFNIACKEHFVKTSDNEMINLLIFDNPKCNKILLYAHGNAGNI